MFEFSAPMRGARPLHLSLFVAMAAIACTPATARGESQDAVESGLPAGNGQAFRQRMMAWSSPSPAPQPPAQQQQRTPDLPRLSSGFGTRSDPLRGTLARHAGVDIPGSLNTPILASADGAIRFAGRAGGYGNMIEIEHMNGVRTRYAHLARILVRESATVRRGQVIALMGSTGRSTGSHLHFEMRSHGLAIDPLPYLGGDMQPRAVRYTPSTPFLSTFARARLSETENAPSR